MESIETTLNEGGKASAKTTGWMFAALLRPVDDDMAAHGMRWRALLGSLTTLATAVAWWMDTDTVFAASVDSSTIALAMLSVAQMIALVGFIWLPIPACVLCVADYLLAAFVPGGQPDMLSLGVMLCVGYLSYRLCTWAALCELLVVWTGQGLSAVISRAPVERLGTVFLINVAAFMAGTAFAYRGRLSYERRLSDKLRAAGALHDAVTGELSAIALLSQSAAEEGCHGTDDSYGFVNSGGSGSVGADVSGFADRDALMRDINRLSLAALDNTHEVIRLLSEADPTPGVADAIRTGASDMNCLITADMTDAADSTSITDLKGMFAAPDVVRCFGRQEQRLQNLGFHGLMTLDMDGLVAPGMTRLLCACVKELCANIARHADPSEPYRLTVRYDEGLDGGIIVEQSNGVTEHTVGATGRRLLRSGFGLVFLREQIERRGGALSYGIQDGAWHIRIRLPR